jgi:glycosyltransferase involved in cell wall biosynthesis
MYSGNAGIVHDFDGICEAMRLLKDDPRIYFLFVGDGPRRGEIERFAKEHEIRNFTYSGYFNRDELRYSLSVADAHLISLRKPFVGISVPGKLYGIMASGRPALFVGPRECESADVISRAECGAIVDPSTGAEQASGEIVSVLRSWLSDARRRAVLGENGRRAFLQLYEREPNRRLFAEVIAAAWNAKEQTISARTMTEPAARALEA